MLRLVPAGGIACVYLLVVQQKQMSTRVNFPVARRGNVVVLLLRLDVQLREIFTTVACDWYQQREVLRVDCVLATGYPAASSEYCVSYATSFENPGFTAGRGFNPAGGAQEVASVSQLHIAYLYISISQPGGCPALRRCTRRGV
ncbi:hypothetical protein F511_07494 [Dorcoceras hygrometricum]|uniref:Uncharacterized protein n=1 Tax=Dorcoceras hygrometricum TaxID=472368 RepID=A0A2Z7B487_9LAMI|nr:hypothetical protein F511_07494 [Dorcoceras hygrometricum]